MDAYQHYKEGERLLKDSWYRDAGVDVASLTVALANAHFQAAIAYAAIVEMGKQDNPPVFATLETREDNSCVCKEVEETDADYNIACRYDD